MKVLFATTNPAKVKYYANRLLKDGIELVTLKDLNIDLDVEEDGKTPVENSVIKATAYYKLSGLPTIAVDDGLFLNNVPDSIQPGTNVRRVNGKRLDDEEMIEYYINIINEYGNNGILEGYFLKGISIVYKNYTKSFEKKSSRTFINKRSNHLIEGYPLNSILIIPSLNKYQSELTDEEQSSLADNEKVSIFEFIQDSINNLEELIKKIKWRLFIYFFASV